MEPTPLPPEASERSGMSTRSILQTTLSVAIIVATLFTGVPSRIFSTRANRNADLLLTPSAPLGGNASAQQPLKIGIIPGHWGNDSGTVCANETTEVSVNLKIAQILEQRLSAYNYDVELLKEFDSRLVGYEAALLLSIHNDSCEYVNDEATGYKVAASFLSSDANLASRLTACLKDRYGLVTGLPYHPGSVTEDMEYYYPFADLDSDTTAAIIETGFMYQDYRILTEQPEKVAEGIFAGVMCYFNETDLGNGTGIQP